MASEQGKRVKVQVARKAYSLCQGEGRQFESGRPLHRSPGQESEHGLLIRVRSEFLAHHRPSWPVLAPTKTRRYHRVAVDPYTQQLLEDRWGQVAADLPGDVDDTFVFTNRPLGDRPWNPNWVTKQFIRHRRGAGIDHFRLHDLRHFMATQMLGSGVAIPVVSARLAHARASTTLNVYAHAIPGADVQAAQLISNIVSSGPIGSGDAQVVGLRRTPDKGLSGYGRSSASRSATAALIRPM